MESEKPSTRQAQPTISSMLNIRPSKKLNIKLKIRKDRQFLAAGTVVLIQVSSKDKGCSASSRKLTLYTAKALVEEISFIKIPTFCLQEKLLTRLTS